MNDPVTPAPTHCEVRLFDARGMRQHSLDVDSIEDLHLDDESLLWVDVAGTNPPCLDAVAGALGAAYAKALAGWEQGSNPVVYKFGEVYRVRVAAVGAQSTPDDVRGDLLTIIAGRNVVITLHQTQLAFIDTLREREENGSAVGLLTADSFVASLLDWQLSTYYKAISDYELALERMEIGILEARNLGCLNELGRLRRWASRMRRMLAPHRDVYFALGRPDFRPNIDKLSTHHLEQLHKRFERAMDMIENARASVLGSFALFSSQVALQTNSSMRLLTFVTVITGFMAIVVGALGMNFGATLFETDNFGFWLTIFLMVGFSAAALLVGRRRNWF